MLALLLAGSLFAASQEARTPPPAASIVVPVDSFSDALALDLALNAAGSGLDLISTDWALQHGCHEANPLGQRVEGRVALKMGSAAVRGVVAYYLRRSGHKTGANIWRYTGLVVDLGVTASNVKCGTK